MSSPLIPGDFERAITLGLSRVPATALDETSALAVLSLLAQRKRHRRRQITAPHVEPRAQHLHDDPRPLLPDAARKPLLRLAAALPKEGWGFLGQAIFDQLAKRGVRLHPFDLPRIEPLLNAVPEYLGAAERAWLSMRGQTSIAEPTSSTSISEPDWILLPKAQRVATIQQLRLRDASTAREWVERNLTSAPADVRAALVSALEVGLTVADTALLERISTDDRAASVRDAALNLLAATRGSAAYAAKLDQALTFIEKGRTLLGRRTIKVNAAAIENLSAGLTAVSTGARNTALTQALERAFQNLFFSDIAKALSLSPEELANALPADNALTVPLTIAAIVEGDPNVLGKMTAHLARFDLIDLINHFGSTLTRLPEEARSALLGIATQSAKVNWRSAQDLYGLGRLAGGIVSDALARKLLAAGPWKTGGAFYDATALAVFASLMPRGRDGDFAASIADLPRKDTAAAYEYFAFTIALRETPA